MGVSAGADRAATASRPSPSVSGKAGIANAGASLREQQLERIIRDTLWMACRYAHGRQSYAVGMYNTAARLALSLGVVEQGAETFAIDGSLSCEMSGLSQAEFKAAWAGWSMPDAVPNHCRAACKGCGSTATDEELAAGEFVACCPERNVDRVIAAHHAQGTPTRSAKTAGLGPKDGGPVGKADAPETSQSPETEHE